MMYLGNYYIFLFEKCTSYGFLPWEFEEEDPIRGPLPQIIYGLFYRLMKLLNLDSPFIIVCGLVIIIKIVLGLRTCCYSATTFYGVNGLLHL